MKNGQFFRSTVGIGLLAVVLVALPFVAALGGQAWVRILDFAILYVFLALGLNIVVGLAGLLDLGYIAFYAVGAYTWALLASPHFGLHWPILAILPVGAGLACLACTKVDEKVAPSNMPVSTNLEIVPPRILDSTKNTSRKTPGLPENFKVRSVAHLR